MTYLLDTNTCIHYLNGTSDSIRHRMESHGRRDISLCSIVKAELLYGALKSGRPDRNLRRLESFFRGLASFPFDDAAARTYGEVRAALERAGLPIGPNDLCIASIALENGLTLVTHNVGEFRRVEGLEVEDWR